MTSVYVIAWSARGPTKVGIANYPTKRLANLQTSHPYRLRLYFAANLIDRDQATKIENAVLTRHIKAQMIGEWLNLNPSVVASSVREECERCHFDWEKWHPSIDQIERRQEQLATLTRNGKPNRRYHDAEAMAELKWLLDS